GEQRLQLMIPILPPPPHMQREVDLGVGGFVHSILPGTGRGTARRAVEGGAARCNAGRVRSDATPLHHPSDGPPPRPGEDLSTYPITYSDSSARRRLRA